MNATLMNPPDESIPTRESLLNRLKDWGDQKSWNEFFETYWRLIYHAAARSGLTEAEAQDAVQETIISIAKIMPGFKYNPAIGSFKGYLLFVTRSRIADQFRRRRPEFLSSSFSADATAARTDAIQKIEDPAGFTLEAVWEKEWEQNLLDAAIQRVKRRVNPKQYPFPDNDIAPNVLPAYKPFGEIPETT